MNQKEIRSWKKVYQSDLSYIVYELKDIVDKPAMIIIEGAMGAGKTTFSKAFVDDGETMSPSYSILSETGQVLHADLYRIESREEIIHLELELYLEDKLFFLVEWGKAHYNSLCRELPEDYSKYLLKIDINEVQETEQIASRNFTLYELSDY